MAEDISIDLMRHREPEIAIDLDKATLTATTYSVTGMTCSSCVASVERALNTLTGVRASVNFASETVHVLHRKSSRPMSSFQRLNLPAMGRL